MIHPVRVVDLSGEQQHLVGWLAAAEMQSRGEESLDFGLALSQVMRDDSASHTPIDNVWSQTLSASGKDLPQT